MTELLELKTRESSGQTSVNQKLSLSSQKLSVLPSSLFSQNNVSTLQDLDLSRNLLRVIPSEIQMFLSLTSLNLSRNSLRNLPPEIGNLKNLVSLNLLSNNLNQRTLPFHILAGLPKLRELDLQYNKKCHNIIEISNHFPQLSQQIEKEKKLQHIDIKSIDKTRVDFHTSHRNKKNAEPTSEDIPTLLQIRITPRSRPVRDPGIVGAHACDRDPTLLRSQLEPWSTTRLRNRLREVFGVDTEPEKHPRSIVMEKLIQCYKEDGGRSQRRIRPKRYCTPETYRLLLQELQLWSSNGKSAGLLRERPFIKAESYMILRSPKEFTVKGGSKAKKAAAKVKRHQRLWDLAAKALSEALKVDLTEEGTTKDKPFSEGENTRGSNRCHDNASSQSFDFTAIAFTYGFVGSPHIDTQNIGPFYGLALGNFRDSGHGGELCVESGPKEVTMCDTLGRFALVDGRYPHWVAPFEGDRYSVIYYRTLGKHEEHGDAVLCDWE